MSGCDTNRKYQGLLENSAEGEQGDSTHLFAPAPSPASTLSSFLDTALGERERERERERESVGQE